MGASKNRPNIVLIITDHFRPDAVGRSTPRLLQLADRGAIFEHAYTTSPLCQPARASIITGFYPSQHGICGNMAEPLDGRQRADTFMSHLQNAGYHTALVGRHHYIDGYGLDMDFTRHHDEVMKFGFDYVHQVLNPYEHKYNECQFTKHLREEGLYKEYIKALDHMGEGYPFPEEYYEDAYIGGKAREFVENYSEESPFYLNIGFSGPHPPFWHPGQQHQPSDVPAPIDGPDSEGLRKRRADYMDKCALLDKYVGEIMDTLEEQGILENTVIIFTSDHGDNLGDHGIWDKRYFYEQSAGIPLIMTGPGVIRGARGLRGKDSKQLVSHLDIYPTILSLAGTLDSAQQQRPGRDLLAILRDERGASREAVFSEISTAVMIRTANWKMVFDPEQGGVQNLYNLRTDSREEKNLAGDPAYDSVIADLTKRMLSNRILLHQYTHDKEEHRLQHVRVPRPE
ncbi:MAG: sulfatase [Candidatus Brocadiia bacterium]